MKKSKVKIFLIIAIILLSIKMTAQTRVTASVSVTIVSINDTALVVNKDINKPTERVKIGMTTNALSKTFERPLNITTLNNGKEIWVYDTTVVYINKGLK
jgi:hypothetical protein